MSNPFSTYRKVEKHIVNLIIAESFIQLINAAFMLVLLIFMEKQGYEDYESAHYLKFRFLGVLALAIPLGIYIKGRAIKPLFYFSSLVVPASALLIIYSVEARIPWLIYLSHIAWGIGFVCIQVTAIPYIMRNASKETQTEAISLSHSTWSTAGVIAGIFIFVLQKFLPQYFDEKVVMQILAVIGFGAFFYVYKIRHRERKNDPDTGPRNKTGFFDYDWGIIIVAMIPTTIIAVGAGLTIPFISLFFYKIHHVDADSFALLAVFALLLVSLSTMMVPYVKDQLGYKLAIPLTQSISIMALVALASTELFAKESVAVYIAAFFYIIRQPLMNMAGPMTSEVTMNYVGIKNQEMVSALTASVWSGGWYLSSLVFEYFRKSDFSFAYIFLITAIFYGVGVVGYFLLTVDYEKKKLKAGH